MLLKVTTWNLEHASHRIGNNPADNIVERRRRVRETIEDIHPDILCLGKGTKPA